jgi:GNAT superfamily N-acetyltransferase
MASSDVDVVKRLWETRFGGDPSTQTNWIEAALAPAHSATAIVAVSSEADIVVGFTLLEVGGPHYTRRYLSLNALDLTPDLTDRNGIFHLSCVRADWEGRGVGSAFYERRLALLADRNVSRAYGIAWHRPHTTDSHALFEKYGFTCLSTIDRYYDRFEDRPHCPDCPGSCTCTASLFARPIELDGVAENTTRPPS